MFIGQLNCRAYIIFLCNAKHKINVIVFTMSYGANPVPIRVLQSQIYVEMYVVL